MGEKGVGFSSCVHGCASAWEDEKRKGACNEPGHVLDHELGAHVRQDEVPVARVDVHGDVVRQQRGQDGVRGRGDRVCGQGFLHGAVAVDDQLGRGVDGGPHGGLVEVGGHGEGVGVRGAGGGDVEDVEAGWDLVWWIGGRAEMGWERGGWDGGRMIAYQGSMVLR